MRLINGKLFLNFSEAVQCGFSDNYMAKVKSDQAKNGGYYNWEFLDDPNDKRKVLVGYDLLTEENKRKVQERFGDNPYEYVIRQPILGLVINDPKAVDFFKAYRFDDGAEFLDIQTVNKYVRADAWLTALDNVDRQTIKKTFNVSVADFYIHAGELIALEKVRGKDATYKGLEQLPGDFPASYQRLIGKVEMYYNTRRKEGSEAAYLSLIDRVVRMTGNKISAKLGAIATTTEPSSDLILPQNKAVTVPEMPENVAIMALDSANKGGTFDQDLYEKQLAVIRHCCGLGNNLNAAQIAKMANIVFARNGWKTISRDTIVRLKKNNPNDFIAGTRGKRAYANTVARQVKRKAPAHPMLYWTLDGWTVELMFREYIKGKWQYNRLVAVIVLDPCGNYPIGYAVGERENADLIRMACRNAIHHVKELFGEPYQPIQLQSDNYAVKNLTPFYQALTAMYFTPAQVGNAKAKVIEPYFMYLNKEYCQARHQNWSGFNVDAKKENQVNRETLNAIKNQFPDRKGVILQIMEIIAEERAKKQAEYVAKWHAAPADSKKVMGVMDYLQVFGKPIGDRKNTITGEGLVKVIEGVKHTYDSFDPAFRANRQLDWTIYGIHEDLSRVLAVSPDDKLRFVLEETRLVPMDLYSTTQADVDYRMRINHFNDAEEARITQQYAEDAQVVREVMHETIGVLNNQEEAALKLMLTDNKGQQKEAIQDAKGLSKQKRKLELEHAREEAHNADEWAEKRRKFISQDVDLSQYGNL